MDGVDVGYQYQCVLGISKFANSLPHGFINRENLLPILIELFSSCIAAKDLQCPVCVAERVNESGLKCVLLFENVTNSFMRV